MAHRRRGRARKHPSVELNITAFMNLMVVLVPFLLMTAVFTHLTILELNLPAADSAKNNKDQKAQFELQVTIRSDALILSDNKGGLIKRIPVLPQGQNYIQLTEVLKQVKARFPDKTTATILSEPNTPYNTLVKVMDAVRMYRVFQDGTLIDAELFPDISIGDAAKK
ncbi:MAG: biopolymer transporter ExbD [Proteobacteria bacterium]|jgi:biopolymer transport protein ExbD|nr:biopolymer transporter ExbD [Pseudomonadota bacterium]